MVCKLLSCGRWWGRSMMQKGPAAIPGLSCTFWALNGLGLEVHTTHAAARRHCGAGSRLLRQLGDHGLGGDQKRRNRSCVLDRHTHDLGRVDDALGDQVAVVAALRVEAISV